jgi:hypothetical protein
MVECTERLVVHDNQDHTTILTKQHILTPKERDSVITYYKHSLLMHFGERN